MERLQILRGKVDLRLADALGASSKAEAVRRMEQDKRLDLEANVKQEKMMEDDSKDVLAKKSRLKELISAVRAGPTPSPSVCLYKLPVTGYTCASLASGCRVLVAGSERSVAEVWGAFPRVDSQNGALRRRRIRLGCDQLGEGLSEEVDESNELEAPRGDRVQLVGHSGPVLAVRFLPGGPDNEPWRALTAGEDCQMRLWESANGFATTLASYRGHAYPVWCLDVDRLGVNVVTGSMDRTARLWHTERAHPLRIYAGHERDVDAVAMHPNCNYVATAAADRTVRLWSHADAKMVR